MVKIKYIFTILIIIYMTGVHFSPPEASVMTSDLISGNKTTQIISTLIYLVVIGMLIIKWKYVFRLCANNIFIWVVLLWVFTSFFWSGEPSLTVRRAFGLLGTTLIGLYIASNYDYEDLSRIAGWSFLVINLLSLMAVLFYPSLGIMSDPYGWRGIYKNKNSLGMIALFGIIIFPSLFSNKAKKTPWIIGFILSCILLIGSNSLTSLLMAAFALVLWSILFAFLNKLKILFIVIIFFLFAILILGIGIYFTYNIETVFNVLGKDSTFTGRTEIWNVVLLLIRQSPWHGYGYGAVWIGRDYGIGSYVGKSINYFATSAHNGYLDVLLEIGMIGLTLVSIVLITTLNKLLSNIRKSTILNYYQIWPIIFLVVFIFYNSMEAVLLVQNSVAWIFITIFAYSIPKNKFILYRLSNMILGRRILSRPIGFEGTRIPECH